jgi:two-component system OmpR family response regulator
MPASAILVVDDDPDIRVLVAELLRLSGYETATAASGEDALAKLDGGLDPILVLLDIQMPGLDGWATLRAIRESPKAELPVVLCTVRAGLADLQRGWKLGCDGYLVKPFVIGDLVAEVEAVLALDVPGREGRRLEALRQLSEDSPELI